MELICSVSFTLMCHQTTEGYSLLTVGLIINTDVIGKLGLSYRAACDRYCGRLGITYVIYEFCEVELVLHVLMAEYLTPIPISG